MNARLLLVMASCAVALPAVADSGFTSARGEWGGTFDPIPSSRTVEQASADLAAWQRNPVTADGLRQVNGDPGWVYVGTGTNERTRAQVRQELADIRRNPVTADGFTFLSGEAGWVYVGQQSSASARSAATPTMPATLGFRPVR